MDAAAIKTSLRWGHYLDWVDSTEYMMTWLMEYIENMPVKSRILKRALSSWADLSVIISK